MIRPELKVLTYLQEVFQRECDKPDSHLPFEKSHPYHHRYAKYDTELLARMDQDATTENHLTRDEIDFCLRTMAISIEGDDYAKSISFLIYHSPHFPRVSLWTTDRYCEALQELKASALHKGNGFKLTNENGIPFSFTAKILTEYDQLPNIVRGAKNFTITDIDNILAILIILDDFPDISFPEKFEEELISSIKETNYRSTIGSGYDWIYFGKDNFFENLNLPKFIEYIDS